MLEVQGLCRSYGEFKAVKNASFTIGKGEIVGLLGPNGAGKTTIMKMLSGYLEPNAGTVTIDGVEISENPKAAQRGLGYLPENLPVYPELSVADYLDYAADLKGLEGAEKRAEIKRAIQATEIEDKLLSPIGTLSRGYKQRVGVAQAILGQPKLLILDEPTNGLDPTQTDHMRQLIRDIAKEATVILSTHIMQEVEAVCDRVLILSAGNLAVDEKLRDLRRSNRLLLNISLDENAARKSIDGIAEVTGLEVAPGEDVSGGHAYWLNLAEGADASRAGAAVARAVIQHSGELYQLQREQRDLETLFREVSTGAVKAEAEEEVSDAA